MQLILYNPKANIGTGRQAGEEAAQLCGEENPRMADITQEDVPALLAEFSGEDRVILCGGDGTLNWLVNHVDMDTLAVPLYAYSGGTGNDFLRDVRDENSEDPFFPLKDYLHGLPKVTVNGETSRFLNGIGFGIDGMACQIADDKIAAGAKKVNYALISINQLLFHFRCPNAVVTVDGKRYEFKRTWLASAMNGRYYGGGMKVAPEQDRNGNILSAVILHGSGKLKTLAVFPGIFKGKHIDHTEMTTVLTGREIRVEFDRPTPLQIDGETVRGVTSYTATK